MIKMREWLKWLIAGNEMAELERWHVEWHEHRRWLAEFKIVGMALDNMKSEVEGRPKTFITELREKMRNQVEANLAGRSDVGGGELVIKMSNVCAFTAHTTTRTFRCAYAEKHKPGSILLMALPGLNTSVTNMLSLNGTASYRGGADGMASFLSRG
jgi:hypothetical protein